MSHERTVIEPSPGLTVLTGSNNVGKSAIVTALQILCYNENSTYVLRHGAKECSVTVETDDGHTIEWSRKNSPKYLIDGEQFDRLRQSGCPEELYKTLRLSRVTGSHQDQFDVHFGSQKSPIFLLDASGATAAQFFASSSDAIRLVQMQQIHKEQVRDSKKEKIRLEREMADVGSALTALDPVTDLERHVEDLENDYQRLIETDQQIDALQETLYRIDQQQRIVSAFHMETGLLDNLTTPPQLDDTDPLERLHRQLEQSHVFVDHSQQFLSTLSTLTRPPQQEDCETLIATLGELEHLAQTVSRESARFTQLNSLRTAPQLEDTQLLQSLVNGLRESFRLHAMHTSQDELLREVEELALEDDEALTRVVQEMNLHLDRTAALTSLIRQLDQLEMIPEHLDVADITSLIDGMTLASEEVVQRTTQFAEIGEELQEVELAIRSQSQGQSCPVCGGTIDADVLLRTAISGGCQHEP